MNLIETLKMYDDLYFNSGTSPLTDTEYDILKSNAKKEFPNHPYFLEVGAPIKSSYEEINLPFIMGGLEKVTIDDFHNWTKDKQELIIATEKLDGVSIACTWENGKLTFATTRGNGVVGQNILNKAIYFIPNILNKDKISLRGEILLTGNIHTFLSFKNRRNGVTGLLRRDDIKPQDLKLLTVKFYEIIEAPNIPNTEVDRLNFINKLGLSRVESYSVWSDHEKIIEELTAFLFYMKENSNYDIDGLVLTFNNSIRENVLQPKNKVKFKINESAITCKVINIEWDVTRTGMIKPVILIEPTEIMGTTVSRVSGFNANFIISNLIGPNSKIGVVRSGDVIPYVTEVYEPINEVTLPKSCPDCNGPVKLDDKELRCLNENCNLKNVYQVSHFFISMGVENISDKTVLNLGITSIPEMYELTKEYISKLPGFGDKKAELIINEINKTLTTKPENLLAAFGIPLIGRTLSKQICSKFTIDELFQINDIDKLGLGPITSKSLIDNIKKYKDLYEFLKIKGLSFIKDERNKPLSGIKFTLTGEGPMKRSEIQKYIENLGGEVKGIGKTINYLVSDDPNSNSGKMKEAKKFGVPIINYSELFKLC